MLPNPHAAPRAAALIACVALAAAPAAAQVQVTVRPLAPPEAFFVADLLPGSSAARPDLLGITLVLGDPATGAAARTGTAAGAQAAGPTLSLEIAVARESPSPAQIFRGTTDPFVLQQPVRHVTLREMASRGRDVSITDFTVDDQATEGPGGRSGRLPPGTYRFTVTVRDARGAVIDDDELRITFSTASRVELLSPGAPADLPPPVVLGPTPRFLWSGAGAPDARFRVRVVKVDDAGSAVEALQSGFPAWDATVTGTSAFYPASVEALRLEPGATYAWQVTRELSTSGGTERVESPIYWFRVGGAGGAPAAGALELRFAALLRALGLSELAGFTPVGATLEDGRPLPLDRLEELLAAIEAGEVAVLSVRVR
jgi:hypothetical protein